MYAAHYPRRDLPGRCIGIQVSFHDLADPMVEDDGPAAEEFAQSLRERFQAPGMLFEIRQVWQLDGAEPRLIEATLELTDKFDRLMKRNPVLGYLGDPDVEKITFDKARGSHFAAHGGGHRRGLLWVDKSFGVGAPDPWSASYCMRPARAPESPLPPAVVKALKEFVSRF
jgi:hypothetical protein